MWRNPSRTNQNYQIKYVVSDGWRPYPTKSVIQSCLSRYEKEQLKESIGILTVAFTLALSDGLAIVLNNPNILIRTLP